MSKVNTQKITPFLWFDKQAEEAMNLYTSIFPNSEITHIKRWPEGWTYPKGTVQMGSFVLDGITFHAFDAGPQFKFNEAISLFVTCKDQAEIDFYWEQLTSDGGEESMCGWLKDKFGVSWQIVPEFIGEKMADGDSQRVGNMMQALGQMRKLIIEDLELAYNSSNREQGH